MQRYRVKGNDKIRTIVEVIEQSAEGYRVKMIRETSFDRSQSIEILSKDLFETCLRTSYFIPETPEMDEEELFTGIA
jgi:hypothetical protein